MNEQIIANHVQLTSQTGQRDVRRRLTSASGGRVDQGLADAAPNPASYGKRGRRTYDGGIDVENAGSESCRDSPPDASDDAAVDGLGGMVNNPRCHAPPQKPTNGRSENVQTSRWGSLRRGSKTKRVNRRLSC